jgi:hypothetical protein
LTIAPYWTVGQARSALEFDHHFRLYRHTVPDRPIDPSTEPATMTTPLSLPRLLLAMTAAGLVAALTLAFALNLIADGPRGVELPALGNVLVMGLFFCAFTLPVAAIFALPAGWLWQRFGPFGWIACLLLGALSGVVGGYGLLRLIFVPTLQWPVALWFGLGGAVAALAFRVCIGTVPSEKDSTLQHERN